MRRCGKCGTEKPLAEFSPRQGRTTCKACAAAITAQWRLDNPEKVSKHNARRPLYDPEKGRLYRKRYRDKDPERARAHVRKWQARNPISRLWNATRCSARYRNLEFLLPRVLFDDLVTDNCFYCGAAPDPVNGIDRVDNSKGYIEDNVVTACKVCNRAKYQLGRADFEAWILQSAEHIRRAPAAAAA